MNTKRIILSFFLLLVLLIGLVNAQEDFTASTKSSIELCPCSNQAYIVTVENTGTVASLYRVLANKNMAGWVNFNPDRFVLSPGQKGSFYVIVNSDCNIEGEHELKIFIATNNGLAKVIKQALKFSDCYDYSLEQGDVIEEADESIRFLQHDGSYSLCKDEQKGIPILITNNEDFENKYRLFLDAPEWAALNVDSASLGAKKSGIFFVNFDTTDVEGEFDFRLAVISELGKVQRKKDLKVSVGECYGLELELEKEKDVVCGGEDQSYDIIVKNSGTLGQSVNLAVDGPDWAGFENIVLQSEPEDNESESSEIEADLIISRKKVLQLGPGEEKTIGLNVNPPDGLSGNFEIIVHATLDNKTEFRASDILNVNVIPQLDCYRADISTKTSVTNYYNEDFFFAKVKNDGIKKADYDVSLEGVSWVSVNPETLELNPGQTGNLNLNVNPDADVEPGIYGIKINLESNNALYSKNVDIVLKEESESVKKFKAVVKFYQYYIYLLILLAVLVIVFRKRINKFRNDVKKRYEKYKIKSERLKVLKLAREEKKKKEELEKKRKEKERKKPEKKTRKLKISLNKIWVYVILIIATLIFIGHQNRLFNAKYLPLYIRNIFVGYFYYILIGIGVVVALFLLLLLYNYLKRNIKKLKVKKSAKKADKKVKKRDKLYNSPYSRILFIIFVGVLIYIAAYFNLFESIKDFFVLYLYYIILGIAILIIIILLIRFYKPLFKFLKE
jgi:hypothetical protein